MRIFLIFFFFSLTILTGCKKSASENAQLLAADSSAIAHNQPEIVTVDSLIVHDSSRVAPTLMLEYRKKVLLFTGLDKPVQDSLYQFELFQEIPYPGEYNAAIIGGLVRERMQSYFRQDQDETDPYIPDYPQTWNENSEMNVFSDRNGFLTIIYTGHGYSGGAHGYAYEQYKVADYRNQKMVQIHDIADVSKVKWNDLLLKNIGSRKEELFEPATLTYTENFYFDDKSLNFVYGQYEIAPYVSGIIEIKIPYSQLGDALKPEFKQRMQIK